MRTLCILAFLAFAAVLHAQPRGKIAIVRSPYFPTALDTVVKADVIEPVEIDSVLPANLDEYDAVFFQPRFSYSVDSTMQTQLVAYINGGGKLYIQAQERVTDSIDFSNPLWLRFGIKGNFYTALIFSVSGVYGVPNEFTENISDSLPPYTYQSGYGGPYGAIVTILVADGDGSQPLAFISMDTSLRVVADESGGMESYPGYYSTFIEDVVCSYFNLCAEDVNQPTTSPISDAISIIPDGRYHGYSIRTSEITSGDISLFDPLGIMIWKTRIANGENLIELPATLRNGVYFVTVRQGDKTSVSRFAIIN